MKNSTMIHFIGPQDNYDGRFGLEVNSQDYGLIVHVLPRLPFWGTQIQKNADWHLTSYGFGPFVTIVKAKYQNEEDN